MSVTPLPLDLVQNKIMPHQSRAAAVDSEKTIDEADHCNAVDDDHDDDENTPPCSGLDAFRSTYSADAVALHIRQKARPDYTQEELWEFIELASLHDHTEAVELLLDTYAVTLPPRTRVPLLSIAAVRDNVPLVQMLCKRLKYTRQHLRSLNNYVLREVCAHGAVRVLEWLLSHYNFQSRDARACFNACLRSACAKGYLDIVKKLVSTFRLTKSDVLFYEAFAIREAGSNGHVDVFKYLLGQFPDLSINDLAGCNGALFRYIHIRKHFDILALVEEKYGRDAILAVVKQIPSMNSNCPAKPPRKSTSRKSSARSSPVSASSSFLLPLQNPSSPIPYVHPITLLHSPPPSTVSRSFSFDTSAVAALHRQSHQPHAPVSMQTGQQPDHAKSVADDKDKNATPTPASQPTSHPTSPPQADTPKLSKQVPALTKAPEPTSLIEEEEEEVAPTNTQCAGTASKPRQRAASVPGLCLMPDLDEGSESPVAARRTRSKSERSEISPPPTRGVRQRRTRRRKRSSLSELDAFLSLAATTSTCDDPSKQGPTSAPSSAPVSPHLVPCSAPADQHVHFASDITPSSKSAPSSPRPTPSVSPPSLDAIAEEGSTHPPPAEKKCQQQDSANSSPKRLSPLSFTDDALALLACDMREPASRSAEKRTQQRTSPSVPVIIEPPRDNACVANAHEVDLELGLGSMTAKPASLFNIAGKQDVAVDDGVTLSSREESKEPFFCALDDKDMHIALNVVLPISHNQSILLSPRAEANGRMLLFTFAGTMGLPDHRRPSPPTGPSPLPAMQQKQTAA